MGWDHGLSEEDSSSAPRIGIRCQKTKRDGNTCKASALIGKKYCALHSDDGRAAELGSKGGRRRSVYKPGDLREFTAPKTASDLRDLLAESIVEIRAGKLDPRVGNALGYLGASYLRALEVSEIESRLDALETSQRSAERAIFQSNPADSKREERS